jgi:hypothetical protein
VQQVLPRQPGLRFHVQGTTFSHSKGHMGVRSASVPAASDDKHKSAACLKAARATAGWRHARA